MTPRAVIVFALIADEDLLVMRQAGIQVLGTLGEDHQPDPAVPSGNLGRPLPAARGADGSTSATMPVLPPAC